MKRREERAVAIPWSEDGGALDGRYIDGADAEALGVVVAPPHPLYGGSMDSPVVNELAYAARDAGLASLCFDWRGVGASAGTPSGEVADAVADYKAALDHLVATVSGTVVAAGYSFGAGAAVAASSGRPEVRRLLLVAPPPQMIDADTLAGFPGSVLAIAAEHDAIAPPAQVEAIVAAHPRGRLEVIAAADHFFGVGLADIGRLAGEWLAGGD